MYYSLINEVNVNGQICRIYPNPGDGTVHLLFPSGMKQAVVSVVNLVGQTLWGPYQYDDIAINGEVVVNLDDLPDGAYFIEIISEATGSCMIRYNLRR